LVKFDYAGDADDFPLEGVDPQVSRILEPAAMNPAKI
jgi:hypothetical protein